MVCTSLSSLLRPLFYFLCYIHFSHFSDWMFLQLAIFSSNKVYRLNGDKLSRLPASRKQETGFFFFLGTEIRKIHRRQPFKFPPELIKISLLV